MITGKIGKEFYITKGVLQADALAVFFIIVIDCLD